jgi:outer membrane usher protein
MSCFRWRASVAPLLFAMIAATAVAQTPAASRLLAQQSADTELLLEVEVNGLRVGDAVLMLRSADGRLHASAESLRAWRLRVPQIAARVEGSTAWLPLEAIAGVTVRFDAKRQRAEITALPEAFEPSAIAAANRSGPSPVEPQPGGFLNYALVGSRASGSGSIAAQIEGAAFSRHGVLIAGALLQEGNDAREVVRLDTTYTRDFPGRLESLRIGDAISVGGAWGRPLRVGGVQWGTNFALQPGFVSFPTLTAHGEAALPSTVDIFVNNALIAQQPVPPGPFSISNIPVVSGAGDVQLVVRDLLGREVVLLQPFYGTNSLLRAGLSEYSLEVGAERDGYGIDSFDYGSVVASATWRHGFDDRLTGELRGEATARHVALGGALDALVPGIGVLSTTLAASEAKHAGSGVLAGVGFSHQTREIGYTLRARWSSDAWRQAGASTLAPVPKLEASASLGATLGRFGSLSAAYVDQRFRDRDDNRFATLGWTVPLVRGAALAFTALRNFVEHSITFSATFTIPFGSRDSASLSQFVQRGGASGDNDYTQINVQRSLPIGEGWGYRIFGRSETDLQAGVAYQASFGSYAAEITRFEGTNAVRLSASGGIGTIGGYAFASREITESFGVVRVDNYEGVGILLDNQLAARTDANGYAVLPRLRAYDINQIGIVQGDVPLDATIERLKVETVPFFRSGVLIDFPARRSRGAMLTIVLDDGTPMPPGATVHIAGHERYFPVGLDGETYVTGLGERNRLIVRWRGRQCEIDVPFAATSDPLPQLGSYTCKGIVR